MFPKSITCRLTNNCICAAIVAIFIANAFQLRADQSITLRSGNGSVGSQDAQVRFLTRFPKGLEDSLINANHSIGGE